MFNSIGKVKKFCDIYFIRYESWWIVNLATYVTVVGIVKLDDNILLLKRTPERRTSPNKWQTPSGFLKATESAEEAILREVKEETALEGSIKRSGKVFEVTDEWARWIIVPFLVSVNSNKVFIDRSEHSEFKWINIHEVSQYDCVKGIKEDFTSVGLQ
jgi:8-oxo-dGTP diphosphatase